MQRVGRASAWSASPSSRTLRCSAAIHNGDAIDASHIIAEDGTVVCSGCAARDENATKTVLPINDALTPYLRTTMLDMMKVAKEYDKVVQGKVTALGHSAEAAKSAAADTASELSGFFAALNRALEAQRAVLEKILAFEQKKAFKVRDAEILETVLVRRAGVGMAEVVPLVEQSVRCRASVHHA